MKTIPKYLRAYLENLSPAQKDEVWVWADGAAAIDEVTEIVGNEDGLLNVHHGFGTSYHETKADAIRRTKSYGIY